MSQVFGCGPRERWPWAAGRAATALGAFALVIAFWPGVIAGQEIGSDCNLESYASIRSEAPVPGARVTWLGRPFLVCPDGTRLRSDSAVVHEATSHVVLIGAVRYETRDRRLESDFADYYEAEARLFARGNVLFQDVDRGTRIRGDTLMHLAATPQRPDERVNVSGGRPSAELPGRAEPEADAPAGSWNVTGDHLRFEGEEHFWADGDVQVVRDDLEAFADSLAFDQEVGQLFLNGNARVLGDADVEGDRIQLTMPDDILRSVLVNGNGRLRTDDVDLVGEEIRISLVDERIQRIVAVTPSEATGAEEDEPFAPGQARARAVTEDFILEADSLEVLSPDEVLQLVHAMGRARGESRGRAPGIAVVSPPPEEDVPAEEGTERIPALTDSDWIEGDEILAYFEGSDSDTAVPQVDRPEPDPPGADTADSAPEYRLERLEARGNARTLYRAPPDDDSAEESEEAGDVRRWSISYVVANEIFIYMLDGEVDRLEAHEEVIGIQLEPEQRGTADGGNTGSSEREGEDDG